MIKKILFLFLICNIAIAQERMSESEWIEKVMSQMNTQDKVSQLFVIRSKSDNNIEEINYIKNLLAKYAIGGVCFFQGTPRRQVELTNTYQSICRVPLMISMDAEWGTGMRLKNEGFSYPKNISLGAIRNNQLIYQTGYDIGLQLKRLGVHMNYAPCVDINLNPNNPVINERSFGSDKAEVTSKAFSYMYGLQDAGVLACLKHFPGHGDTDTDSHYDLPVLLHSRERIDSIESFPYKVLTKYDVASLMVGHLHIPSLDSVSNIPATLSPLIVKNLIRDSLKFEGLIITDALEMKGVTKNYTNGQLELMAFKAGNDILLLSENVERSIGYLVAAIDSNKISIADLDEKVRRILKAKYKVGLDQLSLISTDNIELDLKKPEFTAFKEKLYRESITLLKDFKNQIPVRNLNQKMVSISFNSESNSSFQNRIQSYKKIRKFNYKSGEIPNEEFEKQISSTDHVLISLHKLNYKKESNFGLSNELINWINQMALSHNITLIVFGNPYIISKFQNINSIVLAYEDNPLVQDITAQLIFGSGEIQGKAPVDLGFNYIKNIKRPNLYRLGYATPEFAACSSKVLEQIDELAAQMIRNKTTPGCQILVARKGKVIYNKSFGFLRYDSLESVTNNTIYDVASLTKIVATVPSLMILEDRNQFDLKKKFVDYFPEFANSNKADVNFKDFLLHQARFVSWIPFYKNTLFSPDTLNEINWAFYRKEKSDSFSIQVCDSLFLRTDYRDSVYNRIILSKRHDERKFFYSDIGFYFMPRLIQQITKKPFEDFINSEIVNPIGMENFCFNPLTKAFGKSQIAPSEIDDYYRHQEIQGYVHDMGSAMLGGVSGHAGIFSNAEDLAKLNQCFLNRGNYGGIEIISSGTIAKYTDRDSELQRRGIGFDLPELNPKDPPYISTMASAATYGHQGFTGTCVWTDPKAELIYVFLSNRTYPKSSPNYLHKYRYRTKIQDIIYNSFL